MYMKTKNNIILHYSKGIQIEKKTRPNNFFLTMNIDIVLSTKQNDDDDDDDKRRKNITNTNQ